MKSLAVVITLAAVLLAGKVSGRSVQDTPEHPKAGDREVLEVIDLARTDSGDGGDPCVHKGRYFTVDVRKVARQFQ